MGKIAEALEKVGLNIVDNNAANQMPTNFSAEDISAGIPWYVIILSCLIFFSWTLFCLGFFVGRTII